MKLYKKVKVKMQWGRWIFDSEALALRTTNDIHRQKHYSLPLARCNSPVEILDWIITIRQKSWTTNKDIGDLVEALDDLLDLQRNFSGYEKINPNENGEYSRRIIERRFGLNHKNDFK